MASKESFDSQDKDNVTAKDFFEFSVYWFASWWLVVTIICISHVLNNTDVYYYFPGTWAEYIFGMPFGVALMTTICICWPVMIISFFMVGGYERNPNKKRIWIKD